jgi:hypothetical protein
MKKLTFLLITIITLFLFSCSKEGEITGKSKGHIIINGKEYYFIKVVPEDGARPVWLLIPKDSKVETPQNISWKYSCGKNCIRQISCIFISA